MEARLQTDQAPDSVLLRSSIAQMFYSRKWRPIAVHKPRALGYNGHAAVEGFESQADPHPRLYGQRKAFTMGSGKRTAEVARRLAQRAALQGYDVLFDHGQAGRDDPACLGRIASWFGDKYCAGARLALLDIAVVERGSDRAVALIEIEESAAPPKVLLGDVLATLLGERITFQGQRHLQVGAWTTLIVLARSGQQPHPERLALLQAQSGWLGQALDTPNASIGRVVVDRFGDDEDLVRQVARQVEKAISAYKGPS